MHLFFINNACTVMLAAVSGIMPCAAGVAVLADRMQVLCAPSERESLQCCSKPASFTEA